MEDKQNSATIGVDQELTIFEQVVDFQVELGKLADLPVDHLPAKLTREQPKWVLGILERFKKTVLRPILKLRPKNGVVVWRNYGRMVGLVERYKAFLSHDLPQLFEREGLDKITEEESKRIWPLLGLDKLRQHLVKVLNRPVSDGEPLESLISETLVHQLDWHEKLRSVAFCHVAQQNPKTTALFFKGLSEGYTCCLDENGLFTGDRGRTQIYFDFLTWQFEIEKFRRTMPVKSRRDLQNWVINTTKIRIPGDPEWFDHFCDEICLSMKGVGRKPKPQTC